MVDVAIDQGGCFETSKPTTHDQPTYKVDGVVHYCVANMPGTAARTSTFALTNVTLPYVLQLADKNVSALLDDHNFLQGLNVHKGQITNKPVATSLNYNFMPPKDALVNLPFGV
jgi:alanine dehydrogenase